MFLFRSAKAPVDATNQRPNTNQRPASADEMPDVSAERPRVRASESSPRLPHVADMAKPERKVSGIRAAFERNNKRVPSNSGPRGPRSPVILQEPEARGASRNPVPGQYPDSKQSPVIRQDSVPEAKMLSQDREAEIVHLKDELEREKSLRRTAEARCQQSQSAAEAARNDLDQRDAYWREEMRKKVHQARQEGSGSATRGMHSAPSAQARLGDTGLQRQLTELKRSISKSTRVETVVTSDSTFVQEMGSLAHEVQNWTVNSYRRAKISASAEEFTARLAPMVNDRQLERLRPVWARWRPENKIAILQSTVAAILMDILDDQLLFGMPPSEEWTKSLRKTAQHMSTLLEPQQFNRWRTSTLDIVRQTAVMSRAMDSAASTMAEYITSTLDVLSGQAGSETKIYSLQPIVRRTISLSHLFRIQRARFSFDLPAPMTAFDPRTMENVAFDRDVNEGQPIDCATFPFVLKLGDEHGANVQFRNVLLKANVVCGEK